MSPFGRTALALSVRKVLESGSVKFVAPNFVVFYYFYHAGAGVHKTKGDPPI